MPESRERLIRSQDSMPGFGFDDLLHTACGTPNYVAPEINKVDFTCPSWFSSSAKNLNKRILDHNPLTRITIPNILENEWFKKGYIPPDFEQGEDVSLDDVVAVFNDSKWC
ncbi:hypothetical protein IFM89_023257 [Coptis chinensis]|uniref:Uncharacterized protein n=1 Tax=Coptis chinensis TaxID=261450 RepID=A0A835HVT6_9MAGN|nr:hypothetical protein IFM89_023257 [Coptis chinensis]